MKAVFVLAVVLAIAAVVASADDDHRKKKRERDHGHHKGHDRHGDGHRGKKGRHGDKHHGGGHERSSHAGRAARKHGGRQAEAGCGLNMEACCDPHRCVPKCGDSLVGTLQCSLWNRILDFLHADSAAGPSTPATEGAADGGEQRCAADSENYRCVCADGFLWNEEAATCVAKEECPGQGADPQIIPE